MRVLGCLCLALSASLCNGAFGVSAAAERDCPPNVATTPAQPATASESGPSKQAIAPGTNASEPRQDLTVTTGQQPEQRMAGRDPCPEEPGGPQPRPTR